MLPLQIEAHIAPLHFLRIKHDKQSFCNMYCKTIRRFYSNHFANLLLTVMRKFGLNSLQLRISMSLW